MNVSLQINYTDERGYHCFTGNYTLFINTARIKKHPDGARFFDYHDDGQDYFITRMRYTWPNKNEEVPADILVNYQQYFKINFLMDLDQTHAGSRIQTICGELDRQEWLDKIEADAFLEVPEREDDNR